MAKRSDRITNSEIDILDEKDIDDVLNAVDEQHTKYNNSDNVNWQKIIEEIKVKNINYIKSLITHKDIDINAQNPADGKTLLIYAVIIGDIDLVTATLNFGANVHIKDGDNSNALTYAMSFGRYKITELVYYRSLSGSLGNDMKQISSDIYTKNAQANYLYEFQTELKSDKLQCYECVDGKQSVFNKKERFQCLNAYCEKKLSATKLYKQAMDQCDLKLYQQIIEFMIKAISERASFDENMLYISWYFVLEDSKKNKSNPFEHSLWKAMMKTYEEILCDTSDTKGWKWLKSQFVNSLIWYLPHPNTKGEAVKDDDPERMEKVLQSTLFYELLSRVRKESKKQSDKLLKEKIDKIKKEKRAQWDELIKYDYVDKQSQSAIARQDKCGCLLPKYSKHDLSEEKYPPSTHFGAKKHYDTQIYLSELLFRANIIDNMFQMEMKRITKEINEKVEYKAGPVKTLTRSQTKVENDYINEDYPTSAKILDINRCALEFKSMDQLLDFLKKFSDFVDSKKAGCIERIIRCKNGWSIYNEEYPSYTDIKLNVLIQTPSNGSIIAEIQFLLDLMSSFKKKAHKLYAVERKFEMVYNFGLLRAEMNEFKDLKDATSTYGDLISNDDEKAFANLFESSAPEIKSSLINIEEKECRVLDDLLVNILIAENGAIHKYLKSKYRFLYIDAILFYFNEHKSIRQSNWNIFLDELTSKDEAIKLLFVQRLIDLFAVNDTKINNLKDAIQLLSSFGVLIGLLNGDGASYVIKENKTGNNYVFKTPKYENIFELNHANTEFKFQDDSFSGGSVYTFGSDEHKFGTLGFGADTTEIKRPTKMKEFLSTISSVACGGSSLIADISGNVYSYGRNFSGSLGLGDTKHMANTPQLLYESYGFKAIDVDTKGGHSLILTDDGKVYSFGDAHSGSGFYAQTHRPKAINELADQYIVQIACGGRHSAVISKDGKLFTFGSNYSYAGDNEHPRSGQLGHNDEHMQLEPKQVNLNGFKALKVAAGMEHTLVLTRNGKVLAFGNGAKFVLGHDDKDNVFKAKEVLALSSKRVVDIACGSKHSLFVTADGALYAAGNGETGQLGRSWGVFDRSDDEEDSEEDEEEEDESEDDGDNEDAIKDANEFIGGRLHRVKWFMENKISIKLCYAGYKQSAVISTDGKLYVFGANNLYQLGLSGAQKVGYYYYPIEHKYFSGKRIDSVSLGATHGAVVVLDDDNESKESEKNIICTLKVNEEKQLSADIKRYYGIYVKNEKIFKQKDWILISRNKKI